MLKLIALNDECAGVLYNRSVETEYLYYTYRILADRAVRIKLESLSLQLWRLTQFTRT